MRLGGRGTKAGTGGGGLAVSTEPAAQRSASRKRTRAAKAARYRARHRDAVLQARRMAYAARAEELCEAARSAYWTNPEPRRATMRAYSAARHAAGKEAACPTLAGSGSAAHAGAGDLCAGIVLGGQGDVDILRMLFPRIFGLPPTSDGFEWVPARSVYLPCPAGNIPLRLLPRNLQGQLPRKRGIAASARVPRKAGRPAPVIAPLEAADALRAPQAV